MTDTDKLKRLAEASIEARGWSGNVPPPPHIAFSHTAWESACTPDAILALIAENERMRDYLEASEEIVRRQASQLQHFDEAVALLRRAKITAEAILLDAKDGRCTLLSDTWRSVNRERIDVGAFLARIDGGE